MRIATIRRDVADSPNMVANDAAILELVADELHAAGAEVIVTKDGALPTGVDIILHMSRNAEVLERLRNAEERGIKVINSTGAIGNCSRSRFMQVLEDARIPQPQFNIITDETGFAPLTYPAWIKRSKGWSTHKDDVCFAKDAQEAIEAFRAMRERGIDACIHSRHIEGDIIKFYGVGNRYFHHSYPDPEKSKFGLERINGKAQHHPFDLERLKETIFKAAETLEIDIYGGDCIVNAQGEFFIIDFNDFPSFSAVRNEVAKEIAAHIMESIDTNIT